MTLVIQQFVKHKIPLKDETPFKDRVRRIPPGMFEEVKTKIEEMLKSGVIWASHSSWNSNIVFGPKERFNMEAMYRF